MAESLYDLMCRRILTLYNIAVDGLILNDLFAEVMKIYSRSFGTRDYTKITYTAEQDEYTLDAEIFEIEDALWNDLYPSETTAVSNLALTTEQYHHPTLKVLEYIKTHYSDQLAMSVLYDWDIYRSGSNKKIKLSVMPETDIYVLYRKLMTKDTYPESDEQLIESLFKAKVLRRCQSTGLIVTIGDITYGHARLDRHIADLENSFYLRASAGAVGRS